jgi:hypothetical protein
MFARTYTVFITRMMRIDEPRSLLPVLLLAISLRSAVSEFRTESSFASRCCFLIPPRRDEDREGSQLRVGFGNG